MAAEALKLGRGSGASGEGRRAAAAPNMHSLATAAVSDWAHILPQPRGSASPSSPRRARVQPLVLLARESPAPLHTSPGRCWSLPPLSPPDASRGLPRGTSCSVFHRRGLVLRRQRLCAAPAGHSLIHRAGRQFEGTSCVQGAGRDEGNSAVRLPRLVRLKLTGSAHRSGKEMASGCNQSLCIEAQRSA